jgi:D-alanyl-D-alanine dipeptidase
VSPSCSAQRSYFAAYSAHLLRRDPHLSRGEGEALASRFVAPPEVAAYPSGAAVDLTLVDPLGRPLDMGTPIDAPRRRAWGLLPGGLRALTPKRGSGAVSSRSASRPKAW